MILSTKALTVTLPDYVSVEVGLSALVVDVPLLTPRNDLMGKNFTMSRAVLQNGG